MIDAQPCPLPPSSEEMTTGKRRIYILTVNYYCSELVAEMIESVARQGDENLHFIVVDNSPNDPAIEILARLPKTIILRPGINLGFGGGCNAGLDYLDKNDPTAIVWLLNPDATLISNAINAIRTTLASANPKPAILGTKIRDMNGRPWFTSGKFNRWTGSFSDTHRIRDEFTLQYDILCHRADWVSGCSMIFDLSLFKNPPRFDSNIFLYYEDVDICLRTRKEGYPVYVTEASLVEHLISATTSKQPQLTRRFATFSKLYVILRHGTMLGLIMNLLYLPLKSMISERSWSRTRGCIDGLADFGLLLIKMVRARRKS